jgi:integrase
MWFTGTRSKAETLKVARHLEERHRLIRLGVLPAPHHAQRFRSITETIDEYLAWGASQGGLNNRPWVSQHAKNTRRTLLWWVDWLALQTLADLDGTLPRVEAGLRHLETLGRTGKTRAVYASYLMAFCRWCLRRDYLASDPFRHLVLPDSTPETRRRALSTGEVVQLLNACAPERRLLLETAFLSGLRAREFRCLEVKHIDIERSGVRLEAWFTKNRQDGFQPLPGYLVEELSRHAQSREPLRLYRQGFAKRGIHELPDAIPLQPLLYVPSNTSRAFYAELDRAGIPRVTDEGKVDFHATRTTYTNLMKDIVRNIHDLRTLTRHATLRVLESHYLRANDAHLTEAVEQVGATLKRRVVCAEGVPDSVAEAGAASVGALVVPSDNRGCSSCQRRV